MTSFVCEWRWSKITCLHRVWIGWNEVTSRLICPIYWKNLLLIQTSNKHERVRLLNRYMYISIFILTLIVRDLWIFPLSMFQLCLWVENMFLRLTYNIYHWHILISIFLFLVLNMWNLCVYLFIAINFQLKYLLNLF